MVDGPPSFEARAVCFLGIVVPYLLHDARCKDLE